MLIEIIICFYEVRLVLILLLFVFQLVDIIWLTFQICCIYIYVVPLIYFLFGRNFPDFFWFLSEFICSLIKLVKETSTIASEQLQANYLWLLNHLNFMLL